MQEKNTFEDNSASLGLKAYRGKSKVLKNRAAVSTTHITLDRDALKEVTSFTYLGSIVGNKGGMCACRGGGGGRGGKGAVGD